MNERIKELAERTSEVTSNVIRNDEWLEKFAELIVRECAQIGEDTDGNWNVRHEILKNFGLK